MRVSIEDTEQHKERRKVAVELAGDDHNIITVLGLVRSALLAYGFHQSTVEDALGEDDDKL